MFNNSANGRRPGQTALCVSISRTGLGLFALLFIINAGKGFFLFSFRLFPSPSKHPGRIHVRPTTLPKLAPRLNRFSFFLSLVLFLFFRFLWLLSHLEVAIEVEGELTRSLPVWFLEY